MYLMATVMMMVAASAVAVLRTRRTNRDLGSVSEGWIAKYRLEQ